MAKKPTSLRKTGTFLKCRSGNPNGRPRGKTRSVRTLTGRAPRRQRSGEEETGSEEAEEGP